MSGRFTTPGSRARDYNLDPGSRARDYTLAVTLAATRFLDLPFEPLLPLAATGRFFELALRLCCKTPMRLTTSAAALGLPAAFARIGVPLSGWSRTPLYASLAFSRHSWALTFAA